MPLSFCMIAVVDDLIYFPFDKFALKGNQLEI